MEKSCDMDNLLLSGLGHTWIIDLDGTIVAHNGYKLDGKDTFLPGAFDFLNSIPRQDMIVFVTSRMDDHKSLTEKFLRENGVRYDHIIFNAPFGERILINDDKPSGLPMAIAVRKKRNDKVMIHVDIDSTV